MRNVLRGFVFVFCSGFLFAGTGVEVSPNSWHAGAGGVGVYTSTGAYFQVKNLGTEPAKISVRAANTTPDNWQLAPAPGVDIFALKWGDGTTMNPIAITDAELISPLAGGGIFNFDLAFHSPTELSVPTLATTQETIVTLSVETVLLGEWSSVSCGWYSTLAIKTDGTLWAWGLNSEGQLGLGDTTNRNTPTQVGTDNNWASVSSGGNYYTLAIKTDGTLWAWGNGDHGQLGLGDTNDRHTPTQVGADNDWGLVFCGGEHTLAIKIDETLWAWGWNTYGQLGLGDTTNRNTPTRVSGYWISASGGNSHTLAMNSDGMLYTWGHNNQGQLGLGHTTDMYTPTQVGTDSNWSSISCGWVHTLAMDINGMLWAWGRNAEGQLGLGDTIEKNIPTQVGTDSNWSSISCGLLHTLAVKSDRTLWTWGYNYFGQLGLGDTTDRHTPTQVGIDSNWSSVSGYSHTMAIKTDGTLWAWGYNFAGQLGLGDTTNRNIPTEVQ